MSDKTKIEWADSTWNPVTGCDKVSPGCDHCYAETLAERFRGTPGHYYEHGFDLQLRLDKLDMPLRWTKPRRVFVNSMSDLFHDQIPDDYIAHVFGVMAAAPQHTFQVLTKRHGRMRSLVGRPDFRDKVADAAAGIPDWPNVRRLYEDPWDWPLPNVWLGVSVEDQKWANIRIPHLVETPASVRFVSCEPLLGPVDLTYVQIIAPDPTYGPGLWLDALRGHYIGPDDITDDRIHWVIAGGESGHGARPAHPDWFRSIRDQCLGAGVAFHFKQWGEWQNGSHDPRTQHGPDHIVHRNGEHVLASEYAGSDIVTGPSERRRGACFMSRVGKKVAGRELDGREWSEYPEVVS